MFHELTKSPAQSAAHRKGRVFALAASAISKVTGDRICPAGLFALRTRKCLNGYMYTCACVCVVIELIIDLTRKRNLEGAGWARKGNLTRPAGFALRSSSVRGNSRRHGYRLTCIVICVGFSDLGHVLPSVWTVTGNMMMQTI